MGYYLSKRRTHKAQTKRAVTHPRITQPVAEATLTLSAAVHLQPAPIYTLADVFSPTTQPTVTLVPRDRTKEAIKLAVQLDQKGQIIGLFGGSQTGKTVLCECLLSHRNPIVMTGQTLTSVNEFWNRLSDEFRVPRSVEDTAGFEKSSSLQINSGVKGGINSPIISFGSKVEEGTQDGEIETRDHTSSWTPQSRLGVEEALARSGRPIIVDDVHWVPEQVRRQLFEDLKPVARRGTLIVLISVQESVFAPLHAIVELRNRYELLRAPEWKPSSLQLIARKGFDALNLSVEDVVVRRLASASRRNPLLMQKLCREYCLEQGFVRTQPALTPGRSDDAFLERLFRRVAEAQYHFYAPTIESGPRAYKRLTFREMAFVILSKFQNNQALASRKLETEIGKFLRGATPPLDMVEAELKAMSDDFVKLGPMTPFRYDEDSRTCIILAPELRLAVRYHLAPKYGF